MRYLMICEYNYSEERAISLVEFYRDYIEKSFAKKDPVADVAVDIGYACGWWRVLSVSWY